MTVASPTVGREPLTLHLAPILRLSDDQLFELCQRNRDLRIEREASGDLILMTPAGFETSDRNSEINMQLRQWALRDGSGRAVESSAGFVLPDGSMRSPDAAWVDHRRLAALDPDLRRKFLPLCPDFVIELRSPSDPLQSLQSKMEDYLANGARLGWLIDPVEGKVHVYRPGAEVEVLDRPGNVSGEPELPGWVLEMGRIWDPGW
jgi:Uma2 family endonuclease